MRKDIRRYKEGNFKVKNIYFFLKEHMPSLLVFLMRVNNHSPFSGNKFHVAGCNNSVKINSAYLNGTYFDVKGNNISIQIGSGSKLNGLRFFIRGDNHTVTIGENCRFRRGGEICVENNNGSVIIGNQSTVEDVQFASTEGGKITVGQDCMFANDIDVRTGDSHSIVSMTNGERLNPAQDVNINDHVWVGAHVRILKGVNIGSGSIIGTGSVVSRNVPENVVSAGIPSVTIKDKVKWDRDRL